MTEPLQEGLKISSNEDQILIARSIGLIRLQRLAGGWSQTEFGSAEFSDEIGNAGTLLSVDSNLDLTRLSAIHRQASMLVLSVWHLDLDELTAQQTLRQPLDSIDYQRDALVVSSATGDQLGIAGWESSGRLQQAVVMWNWQLHEHTGSEGQTLLSAVPVGSIRMPPVEPTNKQLRFVADSALNFVALGWQQPEIDAFVQTYLRSSNSITWQRALSLPADMPTLAKQAFAHRLTVTASGDSLLMINDGLLGSVDSRLQLLPAPGALLIVR